MNTNLALAQSTSNSLLMSSAHASCTEEYNISLDNAELGNFFARYFSDEEWEHLQKCLKRLFRLSKFEKEWLEEGWKPPVTKTFRIAVTLMVLIPSLCELVAMSTIDEGGLTLEYRSKGFANSLRILNSGTIQFYGVEIDGRNEFGVDEFHHGDESLWERIQSTIE